MTIFITDICGEDTERKPLSYDACITDLHDVASINAGAWAPGRSLVHKGADGNLGVFEVQEIIRE